MFLTSIPRAHADSIFNIQCLTSAYQCTSPSVIQPTNSSIFPAQPRMKTKTFWQRSFMKEEDRIRGREGGVPGLFPRRCCAILIFPRHTFHFSDPSPTDTSKCSHGSYFCMTSNGKNQLERKLPAEQSSTFNVER